MSHSDSPLLEADDLRIDLDDAVVLERASFVTEGSSLVVMGEAKGLMAALAGVAPVRAGRLRLLGRDVAKREHLEIVGLAPLDPPLSPKWTALDYLQSSARLAGLPKSSARQLAREALATVGASSFEEARLGALGVAERRVLILSRAILTMPAVLVVGMPLAGLSGPAAEYVFRAFERATRDRAWIASVDRAEPASLEHALADKADDALAFRDGRLMRSGKLDSPQAGRAYELMVQRHGEALRAWLAERGVELHGGPTRFWVTLGEGMGTDELLAASCEVGAPIVQLSPRQGC